MPDSYLWQGFLVLSHDGAADAFCSGEAIEGTAPLS
jgi:hypothetical protein